MDTIAAASSLLFYSETPLTKTFFVCIAIFQECYAALLILQFTECFTIAKQSKLHHFTRCKKGQEKGAECNRNRSGFS
jgi:hypothetical protein